MRAKTKRKQGKLALAEQRVAELEAKLTERDAQLAAIAEALWPALRSKVQDLCDQALDDISVHVERY